MMNFVKTKVQNLLKYSAFLFLLVNHAQAKKFCDGGLTRGSTCSLYVEKDPIIFTNTMFGPMDSNRMFFDSWTSFQPHTQNEFLRQNKAFSYGNPMEITEHVVPEDPEWIR